MFYRPGGNSQRITPQYDYVFADFVGAATGWLPITRNYQIAVNVSRASIIFGSPSQSQVIKNPISPEVVVLLEMKNGGEQDNEAWPIDQWANMVVATDRRCHRSGYVRLRILNFNNLNGDGIAMALEISRTGDAGAVT